MAIWRRCITFYLGGCLYCALELLWRGRTHGSMFVLGGLCFLLLGWLRNRRLPVWAAMLLGAAGVTALELAAGLLVNRSYTVWDYRSLYPNFRGQVCLIYSLLWIPVSLAGMELYRLVEKMLSKRQN